MFDDKDSDNDLFSEPENGEDQPDGSPSDKEDLNICLKVELSFEERHKLCKPWRHALIVRLLGKRIGSKFVKARLNKMWNLVGELEVIDRDKTIFW